MCWEKRPLTSYSTMQQRKIIEFLQKPPISVSVRFRYLESVMHGPLPWSLIWGFVVSSAVICKSTDCPSWLMTPSPTLWLTVNRKVGARKDTSLLKSRCAYFVKLVSYAL